MSVGQELLDVPLPEMVTKLALGIAEAQRALDENSVETAKALSDDENAIEIVPALTQTIDEGGKVTFKAAEPVKMALLQIGLNPTFYQFSETTIEVTMDIKTTTSTETNIKVGTKASVGFGMWSASVRVDVSHNRKFQKEVHGTSRLFVKMMPVPPPPRIFPEVTVVDNRKPPAPKPKE
jgi:hypothetical protein